MNGAILARRFQFPLKYGYASTVDKSQGRTIPSLVVDCYNFWKPGQLGVAIGRSVRKQGIQVQNFNLIAANLKHPQIVKDFYKSKFATIRQDLNCCKFNKPVAESCSDGTVWQHSFHAVTMPNQNNLECNSEVTLRTQEATEFCTDIIFPLNMETFLNSQHVMEVTQIQRNRSKLLKSVSDSENFRNFVLDAYSEVDDLFQIY